MEQALENIRNRVDAFGVGEPDIALSGNTIEVQIPGSADATVRRRTADLFCLEGEDLIHGARVGGRCPRRPREPRGAGPAVRGLRRRRGGRGDRVLLEPGTGRHVPRRRPGRTEAGTDAEHVRHPEPERYGISLSRPLACRERVLPHTGDRRADPVLRDSREGRGREGCARGHGHRTFVLRPPGPTRAVTDAVAFGVRISECIAVGVRLRIALPVSISIPGHVRGSRSLRGRALPCELGSQEEADEALDAIEIVHEEERFCVVSSVGEQLGCSVRRDEAVDLQRQSGQERLLRVIGETARLEERPVLEIVPASDPRPVTCGRRRSGIARDAPTRHWKTRRSCTRDRSGRGRWRSSSSVPP